MDYKDKYIKYKKKYYQTKQSGGAKDDCEDTINQITSILSMNLDDKTKTNLIDKQLNDHAKYKINSNESKEKSNTEQDTDKDYTFHNNILVVYNNELKEFNESILQNEGLLTKNKNEITKLNKKNTEINNEIEKEIYDNIEEFENNNNMIDVINHKIEEINKTITKCKMDIGNKQKQIYNEEQLPKVLLENGFDIINMTPDGNCLFYCLAYELEYDFIDNMKVSVAEYNKYSHIFLRHFIGIFNKSREDIIVSKFNEDKNHLVKKIGEYGDLNDIRSCSFIFGVDIAVCSYNDIDGRFFIPKKENEHYYFSSRNNKNGKIIYLLHRKDHFDLLQKLYIKTY